MSDDHSNRFKNNFPAIHGDRIELLFILSEVHPNWSFTVDVYIYITVIYFCLCIFVFIHENRFQSSSIFLQCIIGASLVY